MSLHPQSKRLLKHDVQAVAIACIDHRFSAGDGDRKAIKRVLGTEDVEFIQIAGGAGCFASIDGSVQASTHAKVALDVAVGKHHAQKILLTTHTECGAYALAGFTFIDFVKEMEFQTEELLKAKEAVQAIYPEKEVLAGFMLIDESDEPSVRLV